VPSGIPWALDAADPPVGHPRYRELPGLGALVPLVTMMGG
jgi:putative hydrolase of the HAD superfamily